MKDSKCKWPTPSYNGDVTHHRVPPATTVRGWAPHNCPTQVLSPYWAGGIVRGGATRRACQSTPMATPRACGGYQSICWLPGRQDALSSPGGHRIHHHPDVHGHATRHQWGCTSWLRDEGHAADISDWHGYEGEEAAVSPVGQTDIVKGVCLPGISNPCIISLNLLVHLRATINVLGAALYLKQDSDGQQWKIKRAAHSPPGEDHQWHSLKPSLNCRTQ